MVVIEAYGAYNFSTIRCPYLPDGDDYRIVSAFIYILNCVTWSTITLNALARLKIPNIGKRGQLEKGQTYLFLKGNRFPINGIFSKLVHFP